MDEKGYGYNHNCFEGWAREKPKEIYIPISTRQKGNKRPESRASTNLPPYSEEGNNYSDGKEQKEYQRIYPRCPSPDSEDKVKKLNNWIEYKEDGEEYSVDSPTYHQVISSSARTSPAMGTIFDGYDEEDSYMDSDEINLASSHSEYDGDWDSTDENDNSEMCTDEAMEAMRLTRPFNLGVPFGRRCPKVESTLTKQQEKKNTLRLMEVLTVPQEIVRTIWKRSQRLAKKEKKLLRISMTKGTTSHCRMMMSKEHQHILPS